jgi:phage terminase large subunit
MDRCDTKEPSASSSSDPRQKFLRAFEFLYDDTSYRYRAAYGGRGSGKSHSFATALVLMAYRRKLRVLCCREVQNSIKDSVKRLLHDKIAEFGLGDFFIPTETEIKGKNGSNFLFGGLRSNPDQIKSTEGIDIAWVEEASRVSKRSLEILIPTVRKPHSEIWFTWNPDQPIDPVDAMFRGNDPKSVELKAKGAWELPPAISAHPCSMTDECASTFFWRPQETGTSGR